jgi:hypothetical protein
VTELPSSQGSFFGHFRDDRSGFRGRLHLANRGSSQTHFQLGLAAGLENPVFLPGDLAKGEWHTVVLQYRVGNGEARLWLNPNSESDSYLKAETEASPITISNWAFREADGIGGIEVDWIRVVTGFDQALDSVPVPGLRVRRMMDRLRMEWDREPRVKLQGKWSLSAADWFEVGAEPQDEGQTTFVEFSLTEPSAFFRLRLR